MASDPSCNTRGCTCVARGPTWRASRVACAVGITTRAWEVVLASYAGAHATHAGSLATQVHYIALACIHMPRMRPCWRGKQGLMPRMSDYMRASQPTSAVSRATCEAAGSCCDASNPSYAGCNPSFGAGRRGQCEFLRADAVIARARRTIPIDRHAPWRLSEPSRLAPMTRPMLVLARPPAQHAQSLA